MPASHASVTAKKAGDLSLYDYINPGSRYNASKPGQERARRPRRARRHEPLPGLCSARVPGCLDGAVSELAKKTAGLVAVFGSLAPATRRPDLQLPAHDPRHQREVFLCRADGAAR